MIKNDLRLTEKLKKDSFWLKRIEQKYPSAYPCAIALILEVQNKIFNLLEEKK